MVEVYYLQYINGCDREKWVIHFDSIKDATTWANFYHQRVEEFIDSDSNDLVSLDWCIKSIACEPYTHTAATCTKEQADALPLPDTLDEPTCWCIG